MGSSGDAYGSKIYSRLVMTWLFKVVLRQRLGEQRMEGLQLASRIDREQVFSGPRGPLGTPSSVRPSVGAKNLDQLYKTKAKTKKMTKTK